jgi:hypothetical protein
MPDPRYQQQSSGRQNQQGGRGGGKGAKFSQQHMLQTARAIANGDKKKSNYQVVSHLE